MDHPVFDVVVGEGAKCSECQTPVVRGAIVRMKPIPVRSGIPTATGNSTQSAACAAKELLPIWDAEHPEVSRETRPAKYETR